jgi:hypothetical protein
MLRIRNKHLQRCSCWYVLGAGYLKLSRAVQIHQAVSKVSEQHHSFPKGGGNYHDFSPLCVPYRGIVTLYTQ